MHRGTGYYALIDRFVEMDFETERKGCLPTSWKALLPTNPLTLSEIVEQDGSFVVYEVFVNPRNSCHFVRRPREVYATRGVAEVAAAGRRDGGLRDATGAEKEHSLN
ncbi:MAG: hypothetical protein KDC66_18785 [Phaeodactylibacter sp.]|nr:hypothetical protein [Phaeodactylibacter sp.]MCB9275556.1 hypothetical protein [Lewinellaceae bacterium]